MECLVCRDLARTYDRELSELIDARSSACYRVTKKFAAAKNVDMERARYELEEHRLLCASVGKVLTLSRERVIPLRLRHSAA
jgi:hypothetical protein